MKRRGFTLLEVLIAVVVGVLMLVALMSFLSSQQRTFQRGTAHQDAARELALLSRHVYTALKSIHAPIRLDARYDLWTAGEEDGRPLSNDVLIEATGTRIRYWSYSLESPGQRDARSITREGGQLVLGGKSRSRRLGDHLTRLAFSRVPGRPSAVTVTMEVQADSLPGQPPVTSSAQFTVAFESDRNITR